MLPFHMITCGHLDVVAPNREEQGTFWYEIWFDFKHDKIGFFKASGRQNVNECVFHKKNQRNLINYSINLLFEEFVVKLNDIKLVGWWLRKFSVTCGV